MQERVVLSLSCDAFHVSDGEPGQQDIVPGFVSFGYFHEVPGHDVLRTIVEACLVRLLGTIVPLGCKHAVPSHGV